MAEDTPVALEAGQRLPFLLDFAKAAYSLSTYAACVNWQGGKNTKEWLADLRVKIELVQELEPAAVATLKAVAAESEWRDIAGAPRGRRVLVVSKRFPDPHEAMLYDDGWHTWGVSGAYKDDPYMWRELPPGPVKAKVNEKEAV